MKLVIIIIILLIVLIVSGIFIFKNEKYIKTKSNAKFKEKYLNTSKPKFKETLDDAKELLDSINVKFHLHSGTALGAIREKDFIKHDNDIDLGIFKEDYKEIIIETMKKKFNLHEKHGTIDNGLELKFVHKKNNINIDIFLIYKKENKLFQSVYNCKSNRFEKGSNSDDQCILYMNNYEPVLINFLGKEYYCAPISFLVDRYGKDWNVPKVYNFFEGLEKHYGSL